LSTVYILSNVLCQLSTVRCPHCVCSVTVQFTSCYPLSTVRFLLFIVCCSLSPVYIVHSPLSSIVRCPQNAVRTRSTVHYPQSILSAVPYSIYIVLCLLHNHSPLSAVLCPLSIVCCTRSTVLCPLSSVRFLLSALHGPLHCPQSSVHSKFPTHN
jgi:hypothetical protein